ncbi:MAG: PAS domain S-box protein, partial [Chloroflexi bacterium]
MALGPRSNPFAILTALLLVLFLTTLAFHLLTAQRVPGASGSAGLNAATELLLKVLGGIILLVLLYAALARFARRETSPSTGFVQDSVFLDIVARLRDKEHELERLRSAAEERAREIESYNENILRSVSSGVITFNRESVVTTFNDAAGRIMRLNRADVIGKTCAEVFGAGSTVAGLLNRCLSAGETITREELELRLQQGERIWIGVSTTLLKDREGSLIGTTFVCTDLTEIKALQEQVAMRERMTVLGQMSAGIAHEFRNLMGTILGAAKLIARQTPPDSPVHESVQTVTHVISDMDHIITQFLNFARKTDLDLRQVDMGPWLKRVVEQVLEQVPPPHPHVEVTCFPDVPQIRIDEVLMRQALGNLVQNA